MTSAALANTVINAIDRLSRDTTDLVIMARDLERGDVEMAGEACAAYRRRSRIET